MLDGQKHDENLIDENAVSKEVRSIVFIKPIVKKFVTGYQTVYMVVSEKGRGLAVFDTIKACKHFAIRNQFEYHYVH